VRSFLRLTVQDQDIERNVQLYADRTTDPSTSSRGSQLLYSYKLNPQTVLFAGYSSNSSEDDVRGTLEETGRTLFFKLSYAWTP
jgi:protein involved in polysaccharide export with SLBB domain